MNGKSKETVAHLAALSAFNRIAEPIDIAHVVAFLASDLSSFVNGQYLLVNGGATQ